MLSVCVYVQVDLASTLLGRAIVSSAFVALFRSQSCARPWAYALALFVATAAFAVTVEARRRRAFLNLRRQALADTKQL